MPYICSKLANDNCYTTWHPAKKGANVLARADRKVLIKGGAGVANKNVMTPHGVVTKVSDEQITLLKENCPSFNRHVEKGFLKILAKEPSVTETKKVAEDLSDDKSSPLTDKKLAKEGKKPAKTNKD